jgi:hypothetical protein
MDLSLGHFGDRRLDKGGPSCWPASWLTALGRCGCGGWERTAAARSA